MFKISVFRIWTQPSKTLSTKLTIFMSWSVKKETKRKRSCANWARPKPNLNNGRPNLREMDSLPLMSWKRNVAAEATKSWRSKTRFRTLTTKSLPSKRPILVWWVFCVLKKNLNLNGFRLARQKMLAQRWNETELWLPSWRRNRTHSTVSSKIGAVNVTNWVR